MNYLNSSNLDVEKLLPKKLNKTTIGLSLAGFATLVLSGIFVKRKVKAQEKTPREQQLGLIAINKKPPGLVNFGNTCFVNSVLQALASMPKFIRNLEELCRYDDFKELKLKVMQSGKKSNTTEKAQQVRKHKEAQLGINEYSSLVCKELLSILHVLNDDSVGNDEFSYQPSDLISLLEDSNDYLSFREQQDSHEVLKLIINCFDDTLKKGNYHKSDLVNISKKELALSNSLLGYLNTYLQCTACDKKFNNRIEAFYDLSLDILDRSVNSLKDTLKNYFLDEFIDDVQCLHCSIAAFISEREYKVIKLQALFAKNNDPNIQEGIQCLKDQIDYIQLMGSKSMIETDDLKVEVQKFIEVQIASLKSGDIKNMISGSFQIQKRRIKKVQTITKTPQILILHLKRLVINPRTGDPVKVGKFIEFEEDLKLDQLLGLKKQENSHSFQLSSLISHLGMDNFGHYVTLRRIWQKKYSPFYSEEINQKQYTKSLWYLTSDREIRYIDKSDVFQARAYILFYEKMES